MSFHYSGKVHNCEIKPDHVAGYSFTGNQPDWLPVTEFDASTETLAPMRFKTSPANIFDKLIAYSAMIENACSKNS